MTDSTRKSSVETQRETSYYGEAPLMMTPDDANGFRFVLVGASSRAFSELLVRDLIKNPPFCLPYLGEFFHLVAFGPVH
jgi:hypothetical protein